MLFLLSLFFHSPLAKIIKYILDTPVGKCLKELYKFLNGNVDNVNKRVKIRVKKAKKLVGKWELLLTLTPIDPHTATPLLISFNSFESHVHWCIGKRVKRAKALAKSAKASIEGSIQGT